MSTETYLLHTVPSQMNAVELQVLTRCSIMENEYFSVDNSDQRTGERAGSASRPNSRDQYQVLCFTTNSQTELLANGVLSIGRSNGNDILVPLPWVSRRHAIVERKSGFLIVWDVSSNGTILKVDQEKPVHLKRSQFRIEILGNMVLKAEPGDCQLVISVTS